MATTAINLTWGTLGTTNELAARYAADFTGSQTFEFQLGSATQYADVPVKPNYLTVDNSTNSVALSVLVDGLLTFSIPALASQVIKLPTGVKLVSATGASGNAVFQFTEQKYSDDVTSGFASSSSGGNLSLTRVWKTADETVASSATFQDDDHLFFTVAANKTYKFELFLVVSAQPTLPVGGLKIQFTGPAGATLVADQMYNSDQAAPKTLTALSTSVLLIHSNTPAIPRQTQRWEGVLKTGANAGTFALQWALNAAVAQGTTIEAGSYIDYVAAP